MTNKCYLTLLTWLMIVVNCPRGARSPASLLAVILEGAHAAPAFGVSYLPLKIVSFPVSNSQAGSLSSTSGTDSCLRIFRIGTNPTRLVGWGPIFPRGPRSVATTLFLGVCGFGRTSRPSLYPDYFLRGFSDMAGALRGRIGLISQHLIDLGVNPTPDHPVC